MSLSIGLSRSKARHLFWEAAYLFSSKIGYSLANYAINFSWNHMISVIIKSSSINSDIILIKKRLSLRQNS